MTTYESQFLRITAYITILCKVLIYVTYCSNALLVPQIKRLSIKSTAN